MKLITEVSLVQRNRTALDRREQSINRKTNYSRTARKKNLYRERNKDMPHVHSTYPFHTYIHFIQAEKRERKEKELCHFVFLKGEEEKDTLNSGVLMITGSLSIIFTHNCIYVNLTLFLWWLDGNRRAELERQLVVYTQPVSEKSLSIKSPFCASSADYRRHHCEILHIWEFRGETALRLHGALWF